MAARDRQQFQFSTLEMLVVAAGYLVTSSFVFLLGFYVGKGNSALHEGPGEHVARVRVEDPSRYVPAPAVGVGASDSPAVVAPPVATKPAAAKKPESQPQEKKPDATVPSAPRQPAVAEAGYSVQVLATRRRADAEAMARSLITSGFDAYVREAVDGSDRWYRVRIGRYGNAAAARGVAERCRETLGLDQAFVSRY
jgi:cell division protein FtsN